MGFTGPSSYSYCNPLTTGGQVAVTAKKPSVFQVHFQCECGLANTGLHISTSLQPWSIERNCKDIPALHWLAGLYGPPEP